MTLELSAVEHADRPSTAARRRVTLVATILASAMTFVDATVVNIALPTIGRDLDAALASQQWVVLAYSLALAAFYIPSGAAGDALGRRRVFIAATAAFALASVLVGLAPSVAWLIGMRVLQGVFGALLATNSLALLRSTFGAQSGAAVGSWSAWTGVASMAGPLVGGVLVQSASWRLVFFINLPFGVAACLLAWSGRCRPGEGAAAEKRRAPDLPGAAALAACFAFLTYALVHAGDAGVRAALWAFLASAAALAAFVGLEARAAERLVPRQLLRERVFLGANVATFFVYAGLGASTFYLALYLQSRVVGFTPFEASLVFVPISVVMLLLSRRFGRVADRRGPALLLVGGPLVMCLGLAALATVDAHDAVLRLAAGLLVFALGLSMVVAPITNAALQAAPERLSGLAAGVNTTVSRLGGLLAIALVGAIVAAVFQARADGSDPFSRSLPDRQALDAAVTAFRSGLAVSAALLAAGSLAAGLGLRRRPGARVGAPAAAAAGKPEC